MVCSNWLSIKRKIFIYSPGNSCCNEVIIYNNLEKIQMLADII